MRRLDPIAAFDDNYIWTMQDDATCLVVDPGDAVPVLAALDGRAPDAILITHHHDDHIGGLPTLRDAWPRVEVFAPEDARISLATRRVGDGDLVEVGSSRFQVLAVPGHTRSHVSYVGEGALFCGDTLFSLGCGRLFEGTPAQMLASLDRLAALPGDTAVCCAHEYTASNGRFALAVEPGNQALQRRVAAVARLREGGLPSLPSTIALERATNPFLRVDVPEVQTSIAGHLGHAPATREDAFAALRNWKDGFR